MKNSHLLYKDFFNRKEIVGYFYRFFDENFMMHVYFGNSNLFAVPEDKLKLYFKKDPRGIEYFNGWLTHRKDSWRYNAKRQALINIQRIFEKERRLTNFK